MEAGVTTEVAAASIPQITHPAAVFYLPDAYELLVLQAPVASLLDANDFTAARCHSAGALHCTHRGDTRSGKMIRLERLREYPVRKGRWLLMSTELDFDDLRALLETTGGSVSQRMPLQQGWAIAMATAAEAEAAFAMLERRWLEVQVSPLLAPRERVLHMGAYMRVPRSAQHFCHACVSAIGCVSHGRTLDAAQVFHESGPASGEPRIRGRSHRSTSCTALRWTLRNAHRLLFLLILMALPVPIKTASTHSATPNAGSWIVKRAYRRALHRAAQHGSTQYRGRTFTLTDLQHQMPIPAFREPKSRRPLPPQPHKEAVQVLTFNVGGATPLVYDELLTWLHHEQPHFVLIQETHWKASSNYTSGRYHVIGSGGEERCSGVLTLVHIYIYVYIYIYIHVAVSGFSSSKLP